MNDQLLPCVCGAESYFTDKYCKMCGHRLIHMCPRCDHRIRHTEHYCSNCGEKKSD